jgi:hypothetical protein
MFCVPADFISEEALSCLQKVCVLLALQEKPKKVIFLGSDGRQYPFLCKAEKRGDLRKDILDTWSKFINFHPPSQEVLAGLMEACGQWVVG